MSLSEQYNYNQSQLSLIQSGSTNYNFPGGDGITGDYCALSVYTEVGDRFQEEFISQTHNDSSIPSNFEFITDATNTLHIKPNEIFKEYGYPSGAYNLTFDFFRNVVYDLKAAIPYLDSLTNLRFFIQQISPSRKELRLFGRYDIVDENGNTISENLEINQEFIDKFNEI